MRFRVRIRLFHILYFVRDLLFPLLKNSKSGVDDRGHCFRSGSPLTNYPHAPPPPHDRVVLLKVPIVSQRAMEKRSIKRTIKELNQFDNKKPEELESEFDHFDAANLYPTSPFKGRNFVDLDFVYKQLLDGHKPCNITLSLTQYQRGRLIGLTCILYLSLQNCSTVTMVKTNIYDVNAKCAADMYSKFLL